MALNSTSTKPKVAFVQDGARLHYAVPLALQENDALACMFTEWFVRPNHWTAALARLAVLTGKPAAKRFAERRNDKLRSSTVHTNVSLMLDMLRKSRTFQSKQHHYEWASRSMGDWVRNEHWHNANVMMGFIRNVDPTLLRTAKQRGLICVGEQMIAPAVVERKEAEIQVQRWPDWEPQPRVEEFDAIRSVEEATWKEVKGVTCPSSYVAESLVAAGVSRDSVRVLPYPIEIADYPIVDRRVRSGKPLVGFVGTVNLRKGIPYFIEVARRIGPSADFEIVGPLALSQNVLQDLPSWIRIAGPVPRSQIAAKMNSFDVFLFPSTCEGSAGSVAEAMASGLPVVTTPNSGSIIQSGADGYVECYDNIDGLTGHVERLLSDPSLRNEIGLRANNSVRSCSVEKYGRALFDVLAKMLSAQSEM